MPASARLAVSLLILVATAAACANKTPAAMRTTSPRQQIIDEIKAFQQTIGIRDTGNFLIESEGPNAVYRCYFTGKLELPSSYRELRLVQGRETGCPVDEQQFDVFFYPAETVATGRSPITPALSGATLERALVVVPHEDFHNQPEARRAPTEVSEAAATLIGFLTASDFAREKYGETSPTFQNLDREARLFLQKATIVNQYYDKMSAIYRAFSAGEMNEPDALARKQALFGELGRECAALDNSVSFNKCPAVLNNAGLAFDRTYIREYPLLFDLYVALDQDTRRTATSLRRLLAAWPGSTPTIADLMKVLEGN